MSHSSAELTIWDNPELYKPNLLVKSLEDLHKCIAPTTHSGNPRCRNYSNADGKANRIALYEAIRKSSDAQEIRDHARVLLVSRCCTRTSHQDKLKAKTKCLSRLTAIYLAALWEGDLLTIEVPAVIEEVDDILGTVTVFETDPTLLIDQVLRSDVCLDPQRAGEKPRPRSGEVYVLQLPSHFELIKIGYSGSSAQSRRLEWAKCFKNATMAVSMKFPYPERMEQLIHLELQGSRKQIANCVACGHTHIELFEMTVEDATTVLENWHSVVAREPLYNDQLQLRAPWLDMLDGNEEVITGKLALELLDDAASPDEVKTLEKEDSTNVKGGCDVLVKDEERDDAQTLTPLPIVSLAKLSGDPRSPQSTKEEMIQQSVKQAAQLEEESRTFVGASLEQAVPLVEVSSPAALEKAISLLSHLEIVSQPVELDFIVSRPQLEQATKTTTSNPNRNPLHRELPVDEKTVAIPLRSKRSMVTPACA